jgi:hypothetical protein
MIKTILTFLIIGGFSFFYLKKFQKKQNPEKFTLEFARKHYGKDSKNWEYHKKRVNDTLLENSLEPLTDEEFEELRQTNFIYYSGLFDELEGLIKIKKEVKKIL